VDGDFPELWGLSRPVQHVSYEKITGIIAALPDRISVSGGGAANVAKIAGMLGFATAFAGSVGLETGDRSGGAAGRSDYYGRRFEQDLRDAKVLPRLTRAPLPTGVCLILKRPFGDPVIAACPGAALSFGGDDIPEDLIKEAKVMAIDGFMLGREDLVRRLLDMGREYGTVAALDLGSASLAEEKAEIIRGFCQDYPLMLFMNRGEAEAYYRALNKEDAPPAPGFWELTEFFKESTANDLYPIIVVKRDKHGALVFAGGAMFSADTLAVIPKDVTGAGDAFCAAFLAAWIRNRPLHDCAVFGNKAAREVLDVPGTGVDERKLKELAKALK
jgi:sugar/nucleoside kinase (ribokinase family)